MEKINVIVQYTDTYYRGYNFSTLKKFVQFLWFRAAVSLSGFHRIPGIHLVSMPSNEIEGLRTACNRFGVRLFENTQPTAEYFGIIMRSCEDQAFERLFQEIVSEAGGELRSC